MVNNNRSNNHIDKGSSQTMRQISSNRLINSFAFGSERKLRQGSSEIAQTVTSTSDVAEGTSAAVIKGPLEWHEYLCEAEVSRRSNILEKIQQYNIHRECLQELLQQSLEETETAYRLTIGLAMAQEQLSLLLLDGFGGSIKSQSDEHRRPKPDDEIDEKSSKKSSTIPQIVSVAVPESDVVSTLEMQHSNLQHKVSRAIPYQQDAAARIKELHDRSMKYSHKLDDRSKEILDQLQETENNVHLAWDSYFELASAMFQKTSNGKSGKNSTSRKKANQDDDIHTIGNVWLAELNYRSAVSQQLEEWEKKGTVLQFNFVMAKDAECQRRIKLRQHLHTTIYKQQSAFSSPTAHIDEEEDWFLEKNDDIYEGCPSDVSANSDNALRSEIDADLDTELAAMMKQLKQEESTSSTLLDSTPSLTSRQPSTLSSTRMTIQPQKEQEMRQVKREDWMAAKVFTKSKEARECDDNKLISFGDGSSSMYVENYSSNVEEEDDQSDIIERMSPAAGSALSLSASETIQERIQRVADKAGAVTFWNPRQNYNLDHVIDVSLAHTVIPEVHCQNDHNPTEVKTIGSRAVDLTRECDKSKAADQNETKLLKTRETKHSSADVAKYPVKQVADPLHRLLYAGKLLESHYVQYAAVVEMVVEEHDGTLKLPKGKSGLLQKANLSQECQQDFYANEQPQLCLAVVTSDEMVHLFDVPEQVLQVETIENHSMAQGGILKNSKNSLRLKVGSKPEDALQAILLQKQLQYFRNDKNNGKSTETASETIKSVHKKQGDEVKTTEVGDRDLAHMEFGLVPILSMHLNEYTVRMTKRGEFGLKITKNLRPGNNSDENSTKKSSLSTTSSQLTLRLKVSSSDDQLAFVCAARSQLSRMEV